MRRFLAQKCMLAGGRLGHYHSNHHNHTPDLTREVNKLKAKVQNFEESAATDALVNLYATHRIYALDVKQSLEIFSSKHFHSPIFCHRHLPIILAHFIVSLDRLPKGLNAMGGIRTVRQTLLKSFSKLISCEIPITKSDEDAFKEVLENIEEAHAEQDLLQTIAMGILELKDHLSRHKKALLKLKHSDSRWSSIHLTEEDVLPYSELAVIQDPLDFCNRCMITYNFLSRMYLNSSDKSNEEKVGMVDVEINLEQIVRRSVDEAKQICTDHYGDCPDVDFTLSIDSETIKFPYMSTTVRYIVLELMKNAFRATVEAHMKRNECGIVTCVDMPPVNVLINLKQHTEHACICISDEGNGMTEKALAMAMAYSYTSVSKPALTLKDENGKKEVEETTSPLAGYGYGLPMSRIYAESFGGDLVLQTMEGYGTRAYYYIKL